eukprot:s5005_g6.t1
MAFQFALQKDLLLPTLQACLVPTKSDIVHLVVRYLDNDGRGVYSAFKALTGKALHNPLTSVHGKDMCVVHAVYGTYSSLLRTAARGISPSKRLEWSSQVVALPEKPAKFQVKGPIYELYPLKRSSASSSELLRIAPWGPAKLQLGKHRKCHLCIQDESAAVSNAHAELCLMVPLNYDGVADGPVRLMVSDSSKNGTWVNEQRLGKERFEELKDGHVLRIADVARYAVRRFNSMGECQRAPPPEEAPEFRVPACPHFLRDSTATSSLGGQGTGQVANGHYPEEVGAEGERKRQREKWQKLKEPDVKIAMLDKIDPEVAQVREKIGSQQQIMKQIKESTEISLKDWIQSQLSGFYSKLKTVDTSSQKISREASRLRDTAGKQQEKELQALQKRGLEIIRQYQKAQRGRGWVLVRSLVMALSLRRVVALAVVALGVSSLSAAISFVALGGRTTGRSRVQMQATRANDKSDNFIDKAFTVMTDIVVAAMPLAQQEKDAYQFYRDGMQAQVAGDYSAALRAYAESLKLEEDPIDRSYIFYNLGIIFGSNGEYVKAVKYYHLALDQNKELCQAYNNIADPWHGADPKNRFEPRQNNPDLHPVGN